MQPKRMQLWLFAARLLMAALPVGITGGAQAETSESFGVSASIVAGCLVDGLGDSGDAGLIGNLDFGTDSAFSTATHTATIGASQTMRLHCTPGVNVQMQIDGGVQALAGTRRLQHESDSSAAIAYSVCADAACALPVAIGGTVAIPVSAANDVDVRLPIFARLSLPGNLPAGSYHDTLIVTLSW